MSGLEGRSLDAPDELQHPAPNCHAAVAYLSGATVKRIEHEPGWRWSSHNAPDAQTRWCPARHVGYVLAGRLAVVLPDGREAEFTRGDAFVIPPGHDAWTVGPESCVTLDFVLR